MVKANIPVILFLTLFTCCSSNKIVNPPGNDSEKIMLSTNKSIILNGNFFTFNTANLYTFFNSADPAFKNIVSAIKPQMLRFPGGTIANFYHPSGKGYGFRKAEIKTREGGIDTNINNLLEEQDAITDSVNFIKRFIPFAKNLNAKIIYVANILSGDISETIQAIQLMQSSGLTVEYVELGNEFYLNAYQELIPDAGTYVKKAKPFAEAIRQKFPAIKLSVPAEAKPHKALKKSMLWDMTLSQHHFYDAVSIHIYPDFKNCSSGNSAGNFSCFKSEMEKFLFQDYPDYLKRTSVLFQKKPLLITEWNIARPNRIFGNTMLHGLYTALFQMENMHLHSKNQAVQLMSFHNLASKENAYSLLTPADLNKSAPSSVNYAVFKMLSALAGEPEFVLVPVNASLQMSNQIKMYAFKSAGNYHVYLLNLGSSGFSFKGFTNESGKDLQIVSAECILGTDMNGRAASLENYRYKTDSDPLNCPPFSITHVSLKF